MFLCDGINKNLSNVFSIWRYIFLALGILPQVAFASQMEPKQIGAEEIEKKIKAMTLEEKVDFIGGYEAFNVMPVERLGIPKLHLSDGPVGIRAHGPATAYPASIAIAAAWDKQVAYDVGKAIAMEAKEKNIHIMLGPGMNIYRFPVTGRNFEYLGEDPHLVGELSKEYIFGMQDQNIIAVAKHYVANNQEFDRHNTSSDMDDRTLHEIYLPAFKTSVLEGKVASIMTAYNPINGIHASQHDHLNNKILKGDWGFDGFIMSDWVSTYDGIAAAKGGLDIEMPSGANMNRENLIPAIREGKLDEAVIDDKIRRILRISDRFGFLANPAINDGYKADKDYVRNVALDAARGGLVLLKNKSKFLPIEAKKFKKIAVIGANIDPAVTGGGGSSLVTPLHPLSLVDAVKQIVGDKAEVVAEKGFYTGATFPDDMFTEFPFYVYQDGKKVQGANADFYLGRKFDGEVIAKKFYSHVKLETADMADGVVPKNDFGARFTTYFTPKETDLYSLAVRGNDGYRVFVDGKEVISMWRDQGPTNAKNEIEMKAGQEYKVEVEYFQGGGTALLYLGIKQIEPAIDPRVYAKRAAEVAKEADLVIIGAGFDDRTEGESKDRLFELPNKQSEFIQQISAVNKNVVVVLNAGGNVEMDSWADKVDGILMAWYPGQEGNLAAAEILFGELSPSGKLPISMEKKLEDSPVYEYYWDHDGDKRVFYGEGVFLGYRYWDKSDEKPRYPFGYGLSYTSFKYSKLSTDKKRYKTGETVKVKFKITNTGKMDGAEVAQLYVADKKSSLPRPVKELKAFEKVFLKRGESKIVELELASDDFAFYNPESKSWEVEPGKFSLMLGSSSEDIRKKTTIKIR